MSTVHILYIVQLMITGGGGGGGGGGKSVTVSE